MFTRKQQKKLTVVTRKVEENILQRIFHCTNKEHAKNSQVTNNQY